MRNPSGSQACTLVDTIREDSTRLGAISFWILLVIFAVFTGYAFYATWLVLLKKKLGQDEHQDYMKMFYYSADATLLRKCSLSVTTQFKRCSSWT